MMLVLIYQHITMLVQTEQIKKAEGLEYYIAKQLKYKIHKHKY